MRPWYVSCVSSGVIMSTRLSIMMILSSLSERVCKRLPLSAGVVDAFLDKRWARRCVWVRVSLRGVGRAYSCVVALSNNAREEPEEGLQGYEGLHGVVDDSFVAVLSNITRLRHEAGTDCGINVPPRSP